MNPLRCDDVKNSLVEYLEFELPLAEREKFYEHLARCVQCRAAHDEIQQVLTDVKAIDVVSPPQSYWDELSINVLDEVRQLRATMPDDTVNDTSEVNIDSQESGRNDSRIINDSRTSKNVIAFSEIRSRKLSEPVKLPEYHSETDAKQVASIQPVSIKGEQSSGKRWPKVAFSIAAAVLVGIATTFSLLERESLILNENVQDNIGFQAQIQSEHSLAELARNIAPLAQSGNQFGFAAQKALFNEFSIASLFSEAKAYAAAGQEVELKTYLVLLNTALQNEVHPQTDIISSVSRLPSELDVQPDFSQINRQLTRLLNEYAANLKAQDDRRYFLARAGAWLFDYALAVLAQDEMSIRQPAELKELAENLKTVGVPPGVIKSLDRMQGLVNQKTLSKREYRQLLEEVENIRSVLG